MSLIVEWEKVQEEIKSKIGGPSYETWLSTIHVQEKNTETLIIETPDDFFKNWIIEHYQSLLENVLSIACTKKIHCEFVVNANILKAGTQNRLLKFEQGFKDVDRSQNNLNPRFTFENFVIGSSNRFACAACLAVAESPAKAYNPLFIYG